MNGSELLLPFVIAERRRQVDQAVLTGLALEGRNTDQGSGVGIAEIVTRLRNQLAAVFDRGQLGPVTSTT